MNQKLAIKKRDNYDDDDDDDKNNDKNNDEEEENEQTSSNFGNNNQANKPFRNVTLIFFFIKLNRHVDRVIRLNY